MACRFEVTLSGEDARSVPAAQRCLAEATRLDECLSVFRDASELSRVNRRAGEALVPVSPELFALLGACARLHAETGGAFDITTTPLSRCWGFLAREARVPEPDALASARAAVGMDGVELEPATGGVRFRRPGMALNLGSIGKGYAVDRVAADLRSCGVRHALVSAGGSSVRALGGRGGGWRVDVTSRAAGRDPVARLSLKDAALATSGIGEQWVTGSDRAPSPHVDAPTRATPAPPPTRYGHVIDPRTGWPAQGLLCATAITSDATRADALATAFLVGGEPLARAYCDAHPGTLALLMPDGATRPLVIGSHAGVHVEEL